MNYYDKIRIGLPKGVVKEKSLKVISNLLEEDINYNALSFHNSLYDIFLLKHRDIPKLLEEGYIDIGISSTEWIVENNSNPVFQRNIEWCNTRISVIVPNTTRNKELHSKGICITEYPNIAKKFFKEIKLDYQINQISGSSEALVPTLFDCCIDCVETGRTLKDNNLIEYTKIMDSKVVVIGNENTKNQSSFLNDFLSLIDNIEEM